MYEKDRKLNGNEGRKQIDRMEGRRKGIGDQWGKDRDRKNGREIEEKNGREGRENETEG